MVALGLSLSLSVALWALPSLLLGQAKKLSVMDILFNRAELRQIRRKQDGKNEDILLASIQALLSSGPKWPKCCSGIPLFHISWNNLSTIASYRKSSIG
jgi:hypothetical protein